MSVPVSLLSLQPDVVLLQQRHARWDPEGHLQQRSSEEDVPRKLPQGKNQQSVEATHWRCTWFIRAGWTLKDYETLEAELTNLLHQIETLHRAEKIPGKLFVWVFGVSILFKSNWTTQKVKCVFDGWIIYRSLVWGMTAAWHINWIPLLLFWLDVPGSYRSCGCLRFQMCCILQAEHLTCNYRRVP